MKTFVAVCLITALMSGPLPLTLCEKTAYADTSPNSPPPGAELQRSFIWLESAPAGQQASVVFRKEFELAEEPEEAALHLFADTRYVLWINGHYVERGPCRFVPAYPEYDALNVAPYLARGANALALLVQHCHDGKEQNSPDAYNGRSMRHAPGLTARLEISLKQAPPHIIATDGSWRGSTQTRYRPGLSTWANHLDDIDARRDAGDARLDTGDWTQPGFDDSSWEPANPIDGNQWGALQPRSIPLLRETPVESLTLVERSGEAVHLPLSEALPMSMKQGDSLVIDAGRFVQAYSVLEFEAQEGAQLELEYAQAFFTTGRKPTGSWDHKNRYTARTGRQAYMSTDTFGFKYLVIRALTGELELESVKLVSRLYPFDCVGTFTCNDPLLDTIWQISIDTILTCSEDAYVDCATRERVEWLGDGVVVEYPITQTAFAGPGLDGDGGQDAEGQDGRPLHADPRLLRNMLRHIGQSQQPDGRVKAHHPSDRWDIHGYIEDYACLWIQGIRAYCEHTTLGDGPALARELWPAVQAQLKWFTDHRTERDLVLAREFVFPGNPLCYRVCEGTTLNAYLYKALIDAAELGRILGETERAEEYAAAAEALKKALNTHLWDEASGTYYGGIENDAKVPPTVHAAFIALYFDIVPEIRLQRVRQWLLEHHAQEGISAYAHMFFLKTLYDMDTGAADQLALDLMRQRWKPMAEGETQTTWEGFGPGEYCHDMGTAPAYFLSRYVLGVRVDGPVADRRILIQPRLADLTHASGVVVTEFGPVSVSWKCSDKARSFEVDVPEGTRARVALPWKDDSSGIVFDAPPPPTPGEPSVQHQGRFLVFTLEEGKHKGIVALSEPPG